MRFHPRHYVLIALLVLLGIWNFVRLHRAHQPAAGQPAVAPGVSHGPDTPGWHAYDQAAALRDAPEAQFAPALSALRTQSESATGPDGTDLRNCQMWLLNYRHNVVTAAGKSNDWSMLATSHVQSCAANHRDIGR